jgi:hypothetical protein
MLHYIFKKINKLLLYTFQIVSRKLIFIDFQYIEQHIILKDIQWQDNKPMIYLNL